MDEEEVLVQVQLARFLCLFLAFSSGISVVAGVFILDLSLHHRLRITVKRKGLRRIEKRTRTRR